ncbi:MAG TPA: hypothetical protein VLI69_07640 [Gammaproteobacteria bacterium]|nr:hypothetical protein [Gammaproteobacteria bacterium]
MRCRLASCGDLIKLVSVHSYKGHLIAQEEKCSGCGLHYYLKANEREKFEEKVNFFDKMADEDFETWMDKADTRKASKVRCEEVMSQAILQKNMPGHDLIQVDTGNRDGQYDLLPRKEAHNIAIEITQAINQTALESQIFLEHHNHTFELKRSQYKWIMGIDKTMRLSKKSLLQIENFLIEIEEYHANNKHSERIESSLYCYSQLLAVEQLEEMGVIYFSGERAVSGMGSIIIQGPVDGSSLDIKYLLRVINQHACKADNIKKLELANVDERHIFIPITAFESGAAYYLEYTPQTQKLPLQLALDKLGVICFIPDIIDVVWLATLMNFTPEKKLGFRLIKVTKEGSHFVIENTSGGIIPYRA